MNVLSIITSFAATALLLWGYWLYNAGIYKGTIVPNPVTWFLWAIGGVVEAGSFRAITEDDPIKWYFSVVCAVVIVVTFLIALLKGKFQKPERVDVLILILDLELAVLLFTDFRPEYTNALVQMDTLLTFAPIIRGTWKKPSDEQPRPWFVWTLAYLFLGATIFMRFEDWWDLMYPANMFVLHLIVGLVARFRTVRV